MNRKYFDIKWHPGQENLGDYQSKHCIGKHHVHVQPVYLYTKHSPEYLPREMKPSDLRGCVGNKVGAYINGCLLPILPW